jgi:hypothetical protein
MFTEYIVFFSVKEGRLQVATENAANQIVMRSHRFRFGRRKGKIAS